MTNFKGNPKLQCPIFRSLLRVGDSLVIGHWSLVILLGVVAFTALGQSDSDRTSVAVEALTRLENIDLEQNAKIKEAVFKLLEKTRGTPDFLRLVDHFKIKNEESALLDLAIAHSGDETGAAAVRVVLAGSNPLAIQERLHLKGDPKIATALAEVLGNTGSKEVVKLLAPLVADDTAEVMLRRQAVRSLAKTEEGAMALLEFAKRDQLAEALRFTASFELSRVRWQKIKGEAAKVLPLPPGQNNQPLPPIHDLLKKQGDIEGGRRVFYSQTVGCATCHKVRGQGTDVGPDLSEIGSKLAKEALYESILDPSAGISFGYEAWQLELKNGDEPYGLIVSETAEELAIKNNTGVVTRYKKHDIKSRQQMKLSIMPSGLQQAMTAAELVDLVEFLASLKKSAN
jgi:putative heme-binding domain-containing protein